MNTIAYLTAYVGADVTSFRRGMAQVRGELTATAGMGGQLTALGGALTTALTLPALAVGGIAVKSFMDFESAMRNANAVAQLSEEQFTALSESVKTLGKDFRAGSLGAANAVNTVFQAGFGLQDWNEALRVTEVAMRAAEAAGSDLGVTTEALVAGLLAYNQGADKATEYSDILVRTWQEGVGTMTSFASGFGSVLPQAAALGVAYKEIGQNLAFLTQRGLSADEASTSLNGILRKLMNPTEALEAQFVKMGVASGKELITKFGGLEGALVALGQEVDFNADKMFDWFNEVRAFRGVASIINNVDTWRKSIEHFNEAVGGATGRALDEQRKSLESRLDRMWSKIQFFFINLGQAIVPVLEPIIDALGAFAEALTQVDPAMMQLIITVGLLMIVIPPIITLLGTLISSGFLPIVVALALLKKAWDDNFLGIRDIVEGLILPAIQRVLPKVVGEIELFAFYVNYWLNKISNIFHLVFEQDLHNLLFGIVTGDWELVRTSLESIWLSISLIFETAFRRPIQLALIGLEIDIRDAVRGIKRELNRITTEALDRVKEAFTNFVADLGYEKFAGIALGLATIAVALTAVGIAIAVMKLPILITALASGFTLLSGALTAATIAGAPLLLLIIAIAIPIALAIGLIAAYVSNWQGFADTINNYVRPAVDWLIDRLTTLTQLLYIAQQFLGGNADVVLGAIGNEIGSHFKDAPPITEGMFDLPGMPPYVPPDVSGKQRVNSLTKFPIDTKSWNTAAGYSDKSTSTVQNNQINVTTNDPDALLRALRARGINLEQGRTG